MNKYEPSSKSPYWSATTKIVIGIALVAALGALVVYLRPIIGPLLLAFVLTYLLYPLVDRVHRFTRLSWGASVAIVYILAIILLLTFFGAAGVALVHQIQSLLVISNDFINNIPPLIAALPNRTLEIGPMSFDMSHTDINVLMEQITENFRSIFGSNSSVLGAAASQTANFFGWLMFVLLISYFILAESRNRNEDGTLPHWEFPGYNYDFYRISRELKRTWNAFLRGQIIVVIIAFVASSTMLSILGVRYALALGLLAALARFVPYLGQFTNLVATGLVCFFQDSNYFGMEGVSYTILVVVCAILLDSILDNMIAVRVLGRSLGLHPAAILVTALIGAQLIGFPGLILAAPVLATIRLFSRYVTRKMFNIDPWLEPDVDASPLEYPWVSLMKRINQLIKR